MKIKGHDAPLRLVSNRVHAFVNPETLFAVVLRSFERQTATFPSSPVQLEQCDDDRQLGRQLRRLLRGQSEIPHRPRRHATLSYQGYELSYQEYESADERRNRRLSALSASFARWIEYSTSAYTYNDNMYSVLRRGVQYNPARLVLRPVRIYNEKLALGSRVQLYTT